MIPTPFDYYRPATLEEAVAQLQVYGEDAKVLSGGHSLIPALKLRLAQPKTLVDISRIPGLNHVRERNGKLAVGAMTTHYNIESSLLLCEQCPLLPEVAAQIGDVQVRNRGTIGGSLVHADPAADWPAPILALEAELDIVNSFELRTVPAAEFFVDMMQSAVQTGELLTEIRVPVTGSGVAYVKTAQRASGFALAGVAVVLDPDAKTARVAVNGVAAMAYRARAVEAALEGRDWTPETLAEAAALAADEVEPMGDIHASPDYRAHLARINARRALTLAYGRAMS